MKRRTRWALGIVGGVFLLLATSAVIVETTWFKERLRRIVVNRANETLNGELAVGELTGSLITGVELHNVMLKQPGGPLFAVERLSLRYDPRILIRGRLVFDELSLTKPVVHIAERAGGWNVANLVKPRTSTGKAPEIHFQKLTLVDGEVSVEPAASAARRFTDFNAALGLTYSADGLKLDVSSLKGRDVAAGWTIHGAAVKYEGKAEGMTAMVTLTSNAGTIAGTLSGKPGERGRALDGHFTVTKMNLAPIIARADLQTDVTGNIQMHSLLSSSGSAPATVSFQVDAPQVVAAGYDVRNAKVNGSYREGVLHLDGSGASLGAFATAKGEWRLASARRSPNSIQLAGHFRGLDVRRVPASLQVPKIASQMSGQYQVFYRPASWAVDVKFDRSVVEGGEIGRGAVVRTAMHGGRLEYDFKGRVARLDLQRMGRALRISVLTENRFKSRITGDLDVQGSGRTLDGLVLRADAVLTDSTIGPTHLPSSTVHANIARRQLVADFAGSFEHVTNELIGAGSTPLDLTGQSQGLHFVIRDLRAPFSVNAIEADGHVVLTRSVIAGYDVDDADLDAALTGGAATVRNLRISGSELRVTAKGTVALDAETESNLTFVLDTDNMATAAQRFNQPIAGAAHIEGSITGPFDRLRAAGTLATREVKYGTSFDALTLNGTFGVDVANQQWKDATVHAETEAAFVTLAGMEIPELTSTTTYHAGTLELDTKLAQKDRTLELGGTVLFNPEQDEARLRKLAVTTNNQVWALPNGREAVIQYGGNQLVIKNLALAREAELVAVDGVLALGGRGAVSSPGLDVKAEHVQLADMNQLLSGTWNVTGVLNGTAHVSGTTSAPDVQSTFTIANGAVAQTKFQGLTAKVGYRDNKVTLDATVEQQPGAQLHAVGTVPFAYGANASNGDAPMDVNIESSIIDIGLFQAFTEHLTVLKGAGQFNVRLTGTPKQPLVNGQVSVADASFTLAPTGTSYMGGNAKLRFEGERVLVDQFVLQDDDEHTLNVTGGAEVAAGRQLRTVDLHITSDHFHLLNNAFGDVAVESDLKATGGLQQMTINGTARIDRGRLEVDRLLERFNKTAYSTESVDPVVTRAADEVVSAAGEKKPETPAAKLAEGVKGTMFDSLRLDIRVNMPDDLVLRARNLRMSEGAAGLGSTNLTLGGVLNLQKEPGGNIILLGGVEVVRGYYEFQGRRFDIVRGSEVRFQGSQPIDPALNVSAEREISGVTAQVGVRGTIREPTIRLSSYPPLDESDILSLIVFGQTVNSLGTSQRVNLAERAGSLALGALAGPLAESVGNALNLDLFEIRAEGQGGSPEVALGSQVGSRFFIGLRQEFGRDEVSTVSFEYRISKLLRLVTSVAQGAQQTHSTRRTDPTGTDLIFVIRY